MKKIAFNDRYELTRAVLEGRKTQVRRIIRPPRQYKGIEVKGFYTYINYQSRPVSVCMYDERQRPIEGADLFPRYKVGEIVAIAQSYSELGINHLQCGGGWENKAFVRAELMPHHIRITNVRIQHLQDISEEDCLAEGIITKWHAPCSIRYYYLTDPDSGKYYDVYSSAREAYAVLAAKEFGKGAWDNNQWAWVYDFELVK